VALRRPTKAAAVPGEAAADADPGFFSPFPALWEFLTSAVYDDGSKRALPTLMLFLHDGRLTAALNDRDNVQTVFVSGDSPEAILDALERGLVGESHQWRPNNKGGGKKR